MSSTKPAEPADPVTTTATATDQSSERAASVPQINDPATNEKDEKKKKKRSSLFGFIPKNATGGPSSQEQQPQSSTPPPTNIPPDAAAKTATPSAPMTSSETTQGGEQGAAHLGHHMSPPLPASPVRRPSTPHIVSPARSQIFERDVQDTALRPPNSPAIPSHIRTEDYIPAVLNASSEAITDDHLDPDSVEIITHSSHQPIAASVASTGAHTPHPHTPHPVSPATEGRWDEELAASYAKISLDREDSASNYGSVDATDVRRLSFISFADVMLAEQAAHGGPSASRESIHVAGLTSFSPRSPSPIRSPVSSQASPPTSSRGSIKGVELSPSRKPVGSPTLSHYSALLVGCPVPGELNIETMTQALRRTGSADLSAVRTTPASPI